MTRRTLLLGLALLAGGPGVPSAPAPATRPAGHAGTPSSSSHPSPSEDERGTGGSGGRKTGRSGSSGASQAPPLPATRGDAKAGAGPALGAAPPGTPTRVEAADIEYLYKERRTIMTGKPLVRFERDAATLVCRRMVADNDEAGEIRHAECEGDVKLTRGDQSITCKHATYDAPAGTIVCRGDPVMRDGPSVLRSEEVVYDLANDRVITHRSKGVIYQRPGQKLPGARQGAKPAGGGGEEARK